MKKEVAAKVEKFFGTYRVREYPIGRVLALDAGRTRHVYQLVSGKVKQYDVTYRGDEIVLNIFKPPAFFPMSVAINKNSNPYILEAATDIKARRAPVKDVLRFLKENPDVMFDLLTRLYRGLDGLLGRVARLMSSSAKARIMYEIIIECRRFGFIDKEGRCTVQLDERGLAARAGLSREIVNREIKRLTTQKLLRLSAGEITVNRLEAFEDRLDKVI